MAMDEPGQIVVFEITEADGKELTEILAESKLVHPSEFKVCFI